MIDLDGWHPASGMPNGKWRVIFGHRHFVELKRRDGKVWWCHSFEAAARKAEEMSRVQPEGPT